MNNVYDVIYESNVYQLSMHFCLISDGITSSDEITVHSSYLW